MQKRNLRFCSTCGHITDIDPCQICQDTSRNRSLICVVQDPKDVIAMEKMRDYQGCISRIARGYLTDGWRWP